MKRIIDGFFEKEKIEYYAAVDYKEARVLREELIMKEGFVPKSIIVFLIPYYNGAAKNISVYAKSRDYHLYARELDERFANYIKKSNICCQSKLYSDHSPIDERHLAAGVGLGVLGKNRLLINKTYGSYVFIAEIITDIEPELLGALPIKEAPMCENCGSCERACPTKSLAEGNKCLSEITQKKGELTTAEIEIMLRTGTVWGCDLCQKACPHNKNPKTTPIPFFLENGIDELTSELLSKMTKQEFLERAFSWRGRKVVERNLKLLENNPL